MPHIATVGTATAITAVSTINVNLTAGVLSGHTVVGAVAWESSAGTIPTISSITDSRGNTWSSTPDVAAGGSGNVTTAVAIIHARITTALQVGDHITITLSSGTRTRWAVQVDDFNDVNATTPLDKIQHNDNPGSSASPSSGVTSTIAQAYELAYAAFGFGAGRTVTIPSGWSGGSQVATAAGSTDRALQTIWQYTSAIGTEQGTLTLSSASVYCGAITTFKATNPSPPVARVSQVKFIVPQPTAPPVARVSQVSFKVPVGVIGVARVAQVKMVVPTVAGQAPYSGICYLSGGVLYNSTIKSAVDGTV